MSKCIISSGFFSLQDFPTGNDSLCCSPNMQPSHILSGFSINNKPFTIYFVRSSFKPPKFKCPNIKCYNQELSCISDWNVAFISTPFSPFLIPRALFSSLELHTLYVVNEMPNCTLFLLPTDNVVFFFLVGFNVSQKIMLLVICNFAISLFPGNLSIIT
jgi:hypothetical protein